MRTALVQTIVVSCLIQIVMPAGAERPRYRTAYACEGSTLNMECELGHVINLIRANYGRFSITICNEHGNTEWSVNCMSARSHRVLHDRCSQQQNCSVTASTRGFGDPCPGTLKYLEAHYQCVKVNQLSNTPRPRPPWFSEPKTTSSILSNDHQEAKEPPLFSKDIGIGMFVPRDDDSDLLDNSPESKFHSSSTTTLRPPPWLITDSVKNAINPIKNITTKAPVISGTSMSTTSATIVSITEMEYLSKEISSTSPVVITQLEDVHIEDEIKDDVLTDYAKEKGQFVEASTISTTTLWVPQAEIPRQSNNDVTWCPPVSGRGLVWNWTLGGEVAIQPCPGGASGWATRPCDPQGWIALPDLGECRSVWLSTLMNRAEAKDSILEVSNDLKLVTEQRPLYGGDITATPRLLASLTSRMAEDAPNYPDRDQREAMVTELVTNALQTGSNLLGRQPDAWGDLRPSEHRNALTKLLLELEEAVFLLAENLIEEKTITHYVPNILMRLQVVDIRHVGPVSFPSIDDQNLFMPTSHIHNEGFSSSYHSEDASFNRQIRDEIILPPEALLENSNNGLVRIVFFSYDNLQKLLQPERAYGYTEGGYKALNQSRILNSHIVSASLGAGRHIELSEPVIITFSMISTINVSNPSCVFWDYTTSSWSEEGCRVLRHNKSHTTCQCDHLTNFAVLMDVYSVPMVSQHQMVLSVITYVGCIISIVCLLLATIIFHVFRGFKSDRSTIHKNLCVCLMLGECFFLGGIGRTESPLLCGFVAAFLHYFFMAAFSWMLLEGFHLYLMLVHVFETEKSRIRWFYFAAYGFPAVVVAVSAVVDPYSYGTPEVCWLRTDNYFIFAFVGPVLLVLLVNSIFLTLSLILMCRQTHNSSTLKNMEHSRIASLKSWVRGAILLMFLLGFTWTFGLLYLNKSSVVFAYVFTVLNSLLGLFIFVFHWIQNDKTRSFRRCGRGPCHDGVDQEASPRTLQTPKLAPLSLHLNNNVSLNQSTTEQRVHSNVTPVNPFAAAAALESCGNPAGLLPDYRISGDVRFPATSLTASVRSTHHNQSPWNHTYSEIKDGVGRCSVIEGVDPVYEEIEKEGRQHAASEVHVSDLSDEDGRRQSSDISRQSSRSYGDHRPLLPYTLSDQNCANGLPDHNELQRLKHQEVLQLSLSDVHNFPNIKVHHQHKHQRTPTQQFPSHLYHHIQQEHQHQHSLGDRQHLDHTIVSAGHIHPLPHTLLHSPCSPHSSHNHSHLPNGSSSYPVASNMGPYPGAHYEERQYPESILNALVHANYDHHAHVVSDPLIYSDHEHVPVNQPSAPVDYPKPIVQPLSEPNLRNWEAVQRHRDLQLQQHLGEVTVAVLNGEQVVCKLKPPPLAPIHENSSQDTTAPTPTLGPNSSGSSEKFLAQSQAYSHC